MEGKDIDDMSASRLSEIASTFEMTMQMVINAILLTLQALPYLDGDEEMVLLWGAWHLNNDRPIPESGNRSLRTEQVFLLSPWFDIPAS